MAYDDDDAAAIHANAQIPARDSLELASLASSHHPSDSSSSSAGISSSRRASLEGLTHDDPLSSSNPAAAAAAAAAAGGDSAQNHRHGRSYSVYSAFDNSFPLSATLSGSASYTPLGDPSSLGYSQPGSAGIAGGRGGVGGAGGGAGGGGGALERHKTLTYVNGLSIVIGLVIGSGIFSSPGQITAAVGSLGASLFVWFLGGVLAWTGAASYAELGGAMPLNGGSQVYLAKIFGELSGFLFTWCAVIVLKPGSAAINSIIFGEYLVRSIVGDAPAGGGGADTAGAGDDGGSQAVAELYPWITKGVAILLLCIISTINALSTRFGTKVTDMFLLFKFVALVGITVVGIVAANLNYAYDGSPNQEWKTTNWFSGTHSDPSKWAVALYGSLWAFDGWDNTNYVAGEFKNSHRDLPRVIHSSIPIVLFCYIITNIAYFLVLPKRTIEATNTIGIDFGTKIFGPVGGPIFALVVCGTCFGSLNTATLTSSRLAYVAGREGFLPSIFGTLGFGGNGRSSSSSGGGRSAVSRASGGGGVRTVPKSRILRYILSMVGDETGVGYTPVYAILLNLALTIVYVVLGQFQTLITFYGVAGYTFYFITVLGLIVLRVREPHLERPYKTWLPTPIIFCCVSLFLLSRAVFAEPLQALIVLGFAFAGVPVYYWRIHSRDGKSIWDARVWKFWRRGR